MPQCRACDATVTAAQLVRHDYPRVTVVHCPACTAIVGRYRRHGDAPKIDTFRR